MLHFYPECLLSMPEGVPEPGGVSKRPYTEFIPCTALYLQLIKFDVSESTEEDLYNQDYSPQHPKWFRTILSVYKQDQFRSMLKNN